MNSTDAARALAARRKRKGPKPGGGIKRFRCLACRKTLTAAEVRRHRCWAEEER